MKLIHKLTLGFLSVALLLAVVGGIQFAFINEIHKDVHQVGGSSIGEVQASIDTAYRVALIGADISEMLLALSTQDEALDPARKQQILDDFTDLETTFASLKTATESGLELAEDDDDEAGEESEIRALIDLEKLLLEYRYLIDQTFDALENQETDAAVVLFLSLHPVLEERIRYETRDLFSDALQEIHEEVEEVIASVETSVAVTVSLTLAAFLLASVIGVMVSRSMSNRIRQLQLATRALQQGDRDVQVEDTHSRDEIGELARTFNEMARDLKTSTASIEDLNRQVRKRVEAETELWKAHDGLENRIQERTRDLENARLEAESANRTKSEFLANMSHELRTPLNHILGFTELVVSEKLGSVNEMQKEYLTDALTSSRHLLSLINDILDLSKVEAGKMELMLSRIEVQSFLNNCLVMFKEKAMKHRITLDLEVETAPEAVLADEIKLKQIIYNVLSNAFKFTPDTGRITVRAWQVNGDESSRPAGLAIRENGSDAAAWAIAISDSGLGIPAGDLERIFSPFEQASNRENGRHEGTGLGLALTRQMVALHGGAIQAASHGQDQGATFTIMLPESAETQAPQE